MPWFGFCVVCFETYESEEKNRIFSGFLSVPCTSFPLFLWVNLKANKKEIAFCVLCAVRRREIRELSDALFFCCVVVVVWEVINPKTGLFLGFLRDICTPRAFNFPFFFSNARQKQPHTIHSRKWIRRRPSFTFIAMPWLCHANVSPFQQMVWCAGKLVVFMYTYLHCARPTHQNWTKKHTLQLVPSTLSSKYSFSLEKTSIRKGHPRIIRLVPKFCDP